MSGRLRKIALLALVLTAAAMASAATPDQLVDYGRFKQARAVLEQQLRSHPNDAHLCWLSARVHRAFGDIQGGAALAQKAVQLDPNNADYHLTYAELEGRIAQQSSMMKQLILVRTIRKELDAAAQLDPKNVDAQWGLLQFYWMAPSVAGGDKSKARALSASIAKLDPVQGLSAEAQFAADDKNFAQAEKFYRKAVESYPKNYDARMNLAEFLIGPDEKKFDQAEEQFRAAMKIDGGKIEPYKGLAIVYAQLEQWQKLDDLLAQSEQEIGDNLVPYFEAGRVLLENGKDLQRAERYFRKYSSQDAEGNAPAVGIAHWRLGQVLAKQGRRPEAIAEMNLALQLSPGFDQAKKDLKKMGG
jgi:tetratricopeptide (TPR) repeat protein